jgi:hypothetical protein
MRASCAENETRNAKSETLELRFLSNARRPLNWAEIKNKIDPNHGEGLKEKQDVECGTPNIERSAYSHCSCHFPCYPSYRVVIEQL